MKKSEIRERYGEGVSEQKEKEPIEIAKSTLHHNKIWRIQEQKNEPYFVIRKLRKYGWVEYDFIATSFRLREEASDQIKKIWEDFTAERLQQWDKVFKHREIMYGFGSASGTSAIMVMDECQVFAERIAPIIHDKANWVEQSIAIFEK